MENTIEKIRVCIPTLNAYDLLDKCLQSAEEGILVPDEYIIIDNGVGYRSDYLSHKKEVLRFGKNIGVGASWNYFLKNYDGIKIIVNDDIEFFQNTILEMVKVYKEQKDNIKAGMISPSVGSIFSCFMLSDWCIENVGYFDEDFYPAYYEDNDYVHRATKAGTTGFPVPDCSIKHTVSSTLARYTPQQQREHNYTFNRNRELYIKKWGGLMGSEKYETPYNK